MTGISARLAAASGAFYVVVIIVGAEIINGDGPLARVGYGLVVLGFAAFVVFLAFLHRVLRDAEGPGGWVAALALGAGLLHSAVRFDAQAPRIVGAYPGRPDARARAHARRPQRHGLRDDRAAPRAVRRRGGMGLPRPPGAAPLARAGSGSSPASSPSAPPSIGHGRPGRLRPARRSSPA